MMRNIAVVLSYNGEKYHGWQIQKNAVTVQETLLNAASSLFSCDVKVIGCGRTDTGVHAKKYVASIRAETEMPDERILTGLNALLPSDIAVHAVKSVALDFHPVISSVKKEYTYYIHTGSVRNPFYVGRAFFHPWQLDTDAIASAASHFVGTHDFASMRTLGTDVKSTVRTVYECEVKKEGNIISIRISADGFLYNMARTIVGTLLLVGRGKINSDDIPLILKSGDRSRAGATAPACGLYMTDVFYPAHFEIPECYIGGMFDVC